MTVATPRGMIEARALVTARMKPLRIDGKWIHQVGLPYHWGQRGLVRGDVVNDLVAISEEPNVRIMEAKALLCSLARGRRPRGADVLRQLETVAAERSGGHGAELVAEVEGEDSPERLEAR